MDMRPSFHHQVLLDRAYKLNMHAITMLKI